MSHVRRLRVYFKMLLISVSNNVVLNYSLSIFFRNTPFFYLIPDNCQVFFDKMEFYIRLNIFKIVRKLMLRFSTNICFKFIIQLVQVHKNLLSN